jgi:hypothetical protein
LPDPQAADDRPEHPELFISYASGDLDRAATLHRLLAAEGFRVWFDNVRLTPGCDWHKEIAAGCEAARVLAADHAEMGKVGMDALRDPRPRRRDSGTCRKQGHRCHAPAAAPLERRGVPDEGGRRAALHDLQSPGAAADRSRNCHWTFEAGRGDALDVSRDAVWRHVQAHLTAETRAALATKPLQREGDTRRILLEWEKAQRRQKNEAAAGSPNLTRQGGVKGQAQSS